MIADFAVGEVYTKALNASAPVYAALNQVCRARPDGYKWMPKYKQGVWDGYISLMRSPVLFPTGLLRFVSDALREDGIECRYGYANVRRQELPSDICLDTSAHGVTLRDYQVRAVDLLLSAQRGIAKMATNAGKTVVFGALINLLGNANALVVVQSKDLLYQTKEKLETYLNRSVGLIGDAHRDEEDVCVATIQTLNSIRRAAGISGFKALFQHNHILVVDECHHVSHNKTFDILMNVPGWYRYGMSGTPLNRGKLNDLKLIACTGPVQVEVSNAELIQGEWSARPYVFIYDYADASSTDDVNEQDWEMPYSDAYAEFVVDNQLRNLAILDIAEDIARNGESALLLVTRISHGEYLARSLTDRGVSAIFVNGSSDMATREQSLSLLATDGVSSIVIATMIFDEGIDVPALDNIILACGGLSHNKLLQRIGRGLRRKKDKHALNVYDFFDADNKYLIEHSNARYQTYKQEGFDLEYVRCPRQGK